MQLTIKHMPQEFKPYENEMLDGRRKISNEQREEIKKLYDDYYIIESDFLTEEDFDELDKLNEKLKEEKQWL